MVGDGRSEVGWCWRDSLFGLLPSQFPICVPLAFMSERISTASGWWGAPQSIHRPPDEGIAEEIRPNQTGMPGARFWKTFWYAHWSRVRPTPVHLIFDNDKFQLLRVWVLVEIIWMGLALDGGSGSTVTLTEIVELCKPWNVLVLVVGQHLRYTADSTMSIGKNHVSIGVLQKL